MVRRPTRFAALFLAAFCTLTTATPITLDFEGIAPHQHSIQIQILEYYNGGTAHLIDASYGGLGPSLGVSFTPSALLLCLNTLTVDCSGTSKGPGGPAHSDLAALYFDRTAPFINVAAGFEHELSLWYTQPIVRQLIYPDVDVGIDIFDRLDGKGNRLATVVLPHTPTHGPACYDYGTWPYDAIYCPFEPFSLRFDGVARSVHFTGNVNRAAFDDIVLGGNPPTLPAPPTGSVPEPASAASGLLALAALWWTRRRQPAAGKARSSRSM